MIQWIIIAIILAACVLWIINKVRCRQKNGGCDGCESTTCPLKSNKNQ